MTAEQRPDIQLGSGSPRSELDAHPVEPPVTDGPLPSPAQELSVNRSGSGGSGPTEPAIDPAEEGASNRSMDELLGGDDGR